MNKKAYTILMAILIVASSVMLFVENTLAAVVEKNGSFLTMISEPNVSDSAEGVICGYKVYYNKATTRMDNNAEVSLESNSTYIYTTEFNSSKYTDDECIKFITCIEEIEAFKNDIENKLMESDSSNVSLSFLYSLTEDDFQKYDVLAYANVYYGSYGNFSVLKSIEETNNIKANLISMDAMEKYHYAYEDIRIMVFGRMVPIVRYYVIPKNKIANKNLDIIIESEYLNDYSQSDLFCEIPWNQIDDSLYIKGDADGNGKISSKDALYVLKVSVGLEQIDEKSMKYADVTSDGKLNSRDALLILQKVAGIINNF